MSTYAIGDVQGCYDELQELLQTIAFNPDQDRLWFVGDLINRGPNSLTVLRFVKSLLNCVVVLGNHELHLLALDKGHPHKSHTLYEILTAPDREELIEWVRHLPLLYYDATFDYVLVHAGLPSPWSLTQAQVHAGEVEAMLRGDRYVEFLDHMYGDQPDHWDDHLQGWDRLRYIVNALTRMRFCDAQGRLELKIKGEVGSQPADLMPWFDVPHRANKEVKIIFGHWAALAGKADVPNVFPLDTGCVWGNYLSAMRLEDGQFFRVRSKMTNVKG